MEIDRKTDRLDFRKTGKILEIPGNIIFLYKEKFLRFMNEIGQRFLKFLLRSQGAIWVFLIAMAILIPATLSALNYDLGWLLHGDETYMHKVFFIKAEKWGNFWAPLTLGPEGNYGWIYWISIGLPINWFFIPFGWERAAVFWPRFLSALAFAISLSLIWVTARKADISIFGKLGIVLLMGLMPGFVFPATSFRPDPLLFLVLIISFYFLMEDEGKFAGNWYRATFAWGIAVAIKISAIFTGSGLAGYLLYFSWQHSKNRRQSLRLTVKSLLFTGAGFTLANLPLLFPKKLLRFIAFGKTIHSSNQFNNGTPMEGLTFWTWFHTSSIYFIWLPWLILLTLIAFFAIHHECRKKLKRPYALIGIIAFWSAFLMIALVARKGSFWNYYLIPAFAAFPVILIGILRWINLSVNRRFHWLYLCLFIVFLSTQFNLTRSLWWERVYLESLPKYEIAKANLETIRDYVKTLPNASNVRIMDELESPIPNKVKQHTRIGPSLEKNFLNSKPDFILVKDSSAWDLPLNAEIPESSQKQELERSRLLFYQAKTGDVQLGERLVQFQEVPLRLKGMKFFKVVSSNQERPLKVTKSSSKE